MAKTSCKKGQYYCNTDKKCKTIPDGYKVREDGFLVSEGSNPRIPRKAGQPAKSKKHSDLYTDEDPKGTIQGLGFKDVATAKASVAKIRKSSRSHAHKIQAAIAMEQRARVMGKSAEAAVYRKFINSMKKKTKKMNEEKHGDHEPEMIRSQLKTASRASKRIEKHSRKKENFKAWVQSKITKASDYLDTAADYLDGKDVKEASSPAQQAAIAISMKKKGKKPMNEGSLRKWFKGSKSKDGKGGWVNVVTGGTCASDEPGEGTPKCVSSSKRASMTKAERKSAARRKKKADPGQQSKTGAAKPTYVSTDKPKKKMKEEFISLPLQLEVPQSDGEFKLGLMFRESLEQDRGMLFVFETTDSHSFHMKNTFIPLDIAFINEEGIIESIKELNPMSSAPVYPDGKIRYAVEVNRGWFAENNVVVGDILLEDIQEHHKKDADGNTIPHEEEELNEVKDKKGKGSGTKDACYHKVKSRYSVWPSAYASGALVKCRKVGAANWGNSAKEEVEYEMEVPTKGHSNWRDTLDEKCWAGYEKKGMKTMFGKRYPNCVKKSKSKPRKEEIDYDQVIEGSAGVLKDTIFPKKPKEKKMSASLLDDIRKVNTGAGSQYEEVNIIDEGKGKLITTGLKALKRGIGKKVMKTPITKNLRGATTYSGKKIPNVGKTIIQSRGSSLAPKGAHKAVTDVSKIAIGGALAAPVIQTGIDVKNLKQKQKEREGDEKFDKMYKDYIKKYQSIQASHQPKGKLTEKTMTKSQIKKRDEIADAISTKDMKDRYGDKNVKYAIATKLAMKEDMSDKDFKKFNKDMHDTAKAGGGASQETQNKYALELARRRKTNKDGTVSTLTNKALKNEETAIESELVIQDWNVDEIKYTEVEAVDIIKPEPLKPSPSNWISEIELDEGFKQRIIAKLGKNLIKKVGKINPFTKTGAQRVTQGSNGVIKKISKKVTPPFKVTGKEAAKMQRSKTGLDFPVDKATSQNIQTQSVKNQAKKLVDMSKKPNKGTKAVKVDLSKPIDFDKYFGGTPNKIQKKFGSKKPTGTFTDDLPPVKNPKPKKPIKDNYDWRAQLDDDVLYRLKGLEEDWQKENRKDKTDGLSQKAVNAYRKENPGSKLKTAVTKDPKKLKKGSKSAKRRLSFCRRMKGMKKKLTSAKTSRDPDSRINKALRRWNC